jgi:hypothetical protein
MFVALIDVIHNDSEKVLAVDNVSDDYIVKDPNGDGYLIKDKNGNVLEHIDEAIADKIIKEMKLVSILLIILMVVLMLKKK